MTLLMTRQWLPKLLLLVLGLLRNILLLRELLWERLLLDQGRAAIELILMCSILCRIEARDEALGVDL